MMKHKFSLKGFTLIELLFVVAIMAVIATIAVTSYQKRTETAKVDKAALQVQQIMQAALAYQTDNGCWPTKGNTGECTPGKTRPDFGPYLPVGSNVSPWDNEQYNYGPTSDDRLFQVTLTIKNTNLGQRVKALLPNATYGANNQPTQLVAEIAPTAGGGAAVGGELLMDMGSITLTNGNPVGETANGGANSLPIFSCPVGYDKAVYTAINALQPNPNITLGFGIGSPVVSDAWVKGTSPDAPNMTVQGWTYSNSQYGDPSRLVGWNGSITALYIEVCVPDEQKK